MTNPRRSVLIGDPDTARFNWLKEILAEEFDADAKQARTFEDVKSIFYEKSVDFEPRVIFLTDDLPFSPSLPKRDPRINFIKLEEYFFGADFVCIVTKNDEPNLEDLNKRPHHVHLCHFPPNAQERQRIITELGSLGSGLPFSKEASIVRQVLQFDKENRILRRQIRALSESNSLDDGLTQLCRLIGRCLNCDGVTKIEVKQMTQGKSGAVVFHILKKADELEEYVIKLAPGDALWKLEAEVNGHLEAQKKTGLPGYKQHVAQLREPFRRWGPDPANQTRRYIVSSGRWYALHYDFLGGEAFGNFIDLETELTAAPAVLKHRTQGSKKFSLTSELAEEVFNHRISVFTAALEGLCEIWYGKDELGGRREELVWVLEDAPEREFISLPPYRLTRRVKSWIQDFLDSREASIGPRLIPDWREHSNRILDLVTDSPNAFKDPSRTTTFTLSPVHGDLNTGNILLWLKYDQYPFLIDLPFYQKDGHALQDFARLEVELKLALLDRQEETPTAALAGYDYSLSQIPLWLEMENNFLSSAALGDTEVASGDARFKSDGYKDNVNLCYQLVMLLRGKARLIQQRPLDGKVNAGLFRDEYLPALLYHSVKAIGFDTLSIFKRLLAVYSSSRILQQINGNH